MFGGVEACADGARGAGVSGVCEGEGQTPVSGALALAASAAYPGLGQVMNRSDAKAAIVGAGEAFLIAGVILEDRRTRNALRLYHQTGRSEYYHEYSVHYDRRQSLIWWAMVVALYSIADAYVDAHLAGFDSAARRQLQRLSIEPTGSTEGGVRLAFEMRF